MAAALASATLLKVSLEDVAKKVMQRSRPAETVGPCAPDITTAAMNAQPSGLIC